jgi:predicted methyltransferase
MTHYLSRFQARDISQAQRTGERKLRVSLDLGLSRSQVEFEGDEVIFPDGQRIGIQTIEKTLDEPICFMLEGSQVLRMQFFLGQTKRMYRLLATGPDKAPTAELSGFRMHRMKDTDPMRDTMSKIALVRPVQGRVLDTCTGLGYTAIAALKEGADEVYSVEVDEGMRVLRETNPWSAGLFSPRIRLIDGDIRQEVTKFKGGLFSAVIHDPPSLKIAGELYSLRLYQELYRVLASGGMLFHYIGSPGSRYRGRNTGKGVMNRLFEAGFTEVTEEIDALGITAVKPLT